MGLEKRFREVANWRGRLDGLVAAAGVQYEAPALEYTAEDCRRILDINVYISPPFVHGKYPNREGYGCVSFGESGGGGNDSNEIGGVNYSHCKYVGIYRQPRTRLRSL